MTGAGRPPPGGAPARCLVVGPSWVGDMVMAHSLFRLLRARHPALRVDVLAPAWCGDVTGRMVEVDTLIGSPFAHGQLDWGGRRRLAAFLRAGRYDWAIVLPNSWKSALVPFLADIPRRTGFLGEFRYGLLNDIRRLDRAAMPRLVDRYLALGLAAGEAPPPPEAPRLHADPAAGAALVERLALDRALPALALCPGAEYGPAKRWPEAHYAWLARARLAAGWQVWLLGSDRDRAVTARINALCGGACHDLAGRTTLAEAIDLLALARAAVCNDSGLMHLAAAVGVPLVAIYGSSDPGYTPPLGREARIVALDLPCRPCFQRECPLGHLDCLNRIGPDRVLAVLDDIAQVHAAPPRPAAH